MRGEKAVKIILVILTVVAVLMGGFYYFLEAFNVSEAHVVGNSHYSDDEIRNMVFSDSLLGKNSVILQLKYRNKPITDIPFIERMDVKFDSRNAITIDVFEKAVAGYVEFLGKYMYFDREGIVVESTDEKIEGIPEVTGLEFDHCIVGKPLPVEDPGIFNEILSITQLLNKYDINTDGIYFGTDGSIILFFGETRAIIGTMYYIDEKMMRLKKIEPSLNGRKGILHLENYSENSDNPIVTFEDVDY
ncbi:MAG: cell division protein FtsQ [Lachnospiraceae bacterium]|nr:cell division protein FtsQ [Lachnospiraceae bacterium]